MAAVDFGRFQTKNMNLQQILMQSSEAAKSDQNIIILGEPGCGRRLLAEDIHEKRCTFIYHSNQKLIRYNKIIVGDYLHKQNQDTTILVEELQALDLHQQENLIKIMAGGNKIIATASGDFFDLADRGFINKKIKNQFQFVFKMPTLIERKEDISLLATHFLQAYSWIAGRVLQLSNPAIETLMRYSWPGNVSELERLLEKAALRTRHATIEPSDLDLHQSGVASFEQVATLAEMEKKLIIQTLQITQNNKSQAARLLGISIRTLRNKLSQYREAGVYESVI